MRNLYARIVLWLIRPALELRAPKVDSQAVIDAMVNGLRKNGPISRGIKGGL